MQRIGDGVGAVVHAKLGQDGLYMVANGFGADMQLGCDLTVAAPGGKQVEDLALAAGQRVGSDSLSARRVRGTRSRSAASRCSARRAAALAPTRRKVASADLTAQFAEIQ